MIKKNKGFTLIELLVVIAIIGVLASVVLAAVNSARTKGSDSAIKANLAGARAQAELFYDNNSFSYNNGTAATNLCHANGSVGTPAVKGINQNVLAAAQVFNSTATITINATGTTSNATTTGAANGKCNSSSVGWAAEVALSSGGFWCVDGNGTSKYNATAGLSGNSDVTC